MRITHIYRLSPQFRATIDEKSQELELSISAEELPEEIRLQIRDLASNVGLSDTLEEVFINSIYDSLYDLQLLQVLKDQKLK